MITVHHLDNSRSLRVLWLLEELGLPYDVVEHRRDPVTRLAPPSLEVVHPLGKAPVIEEDGLVVFESGAILEYLVRRHGGGQLVPPEDSADYDRYQMWLHYSEGSAMLPMMLNLYVARLGEGGTPALRARIDSEMARHLGFLNTSLAGRDFIVGQKLTAADIQLSFIGETLAAFGRLAAFPEIKRWLHALQQRPAYVRAVERGSANLFGQKPAVAA